MEVRKKSVTIKSINRKDKYTLEYTKIAGIEYIAILKNGNPILKCSPREFIKFRMLINEDR